MGEGEYEMLEGDQICVVIVILLTLPLRLTRAVPESDSSTPAGTELAPALLSSGGDEKEERTHKNASLPHPLCP